MPLISSKQILLQAQKEGYAVGAFNVENMEMIQAVIGAAEELNAPVIVQTTPSTIKYAGIDLFFANAKAAAKNAKVPVVMHLDHGNSFELAMEAFRCGYTSVMIDGSAQSFADNIALSHKVACVCHTCQVTVEAELGMVGGKEDDVSGGEGKYTDPDKAREFVDATEIDSLAVAIGTAHGIYKGEPKVDVERLAKIREKVSVPLVLHGTSGVPDDIVRKCIQLGICKVNYATDLRIAFTKGIQSYLEEDPKVIDPKKYNGRGRDYVKEYVMDKIKVCGSENRGIYL